MNAPASRITEEAQVFVDAAGAGRLDDLMAALTRGLDPNSIARDEFHCDVTALMRAADRGHLEIARALLEAGADPDLVSGDYQRDIEAEGGGYRAFQLALRRGHEDVARLLIDRGARLDAETGSPTPLQITAGERVLLEGRVSEAEKQKALAAP